MGSRVVKQLIIYAPNVHVGGGLQLLRSLLSSEVYHASYLVLDARAEDKISVSPGANVQFVKPAVISRLFAEWRLWRISSKNEVILCFHGLPPLFSLRGRVVIFLQNRILVNQQKLSEYSTGTKIRLLLERLILKAFAGHADKFIVQTPSMARDARQALGKGINLSVLAFTAARKADAVSLRDKYDFVYVSNDDPHKNHVALLEAWRILARTGLRPTLALTVPLGSELSENIASLKQEELPHIFNLGVLTCGNVSRLYASASALIFPSYSESFGLPLIEAAQFGLPILAPELDYVRDVVDPVQTFEPHSPVSIARAVTRFLGKSDALITIRSSSEFIAEVMK